MHSFDFFVSFNIFKRFQCLLDCSTVYSVLYTHAIQCDRERELLQQDQNRIVLANLRLEDSCRELRAANSQINKAREQ